MRRLVWNKKCRSHQSSRTRVSSHERFIVWLRLTVGRSCAQLNLKGFASCIREKKRLLWKKHTWLKSSPVLNRKLSAIFRHPLGLQRVIWLVNADHQTWALFSLVSIFKKWLKETVKVVASRLGFFIMIGPSRSTNGQMIFIWKISESRKLFVVRLKSRLVV